MKDDDIQLFDPAFHVSDQQTMTLRSGEVIPLAEHQELAAGILKLCYQRRVGQFFTDALAEERRQLVKKYGR